MAVVRTMMAVIVILVVLWLILALVGVVAALLKSVFVVLIVVAAVYGLLPLLQAQGQGPLASPSRLTTSGGVAERLGRGLQSPVLRFESGRRLQVAFTPFVPPPLVAEQPVIEVPP